MCCGQITTKIFKCPHCGKKITEIRDMRLGDIKMKKCPFCNTELSQ